MAFIFPRGIFKKKRFFVLILLVGVIFLIYQIFSVNQLGKELAKRQFRKNMKSYEKADDFFDLKPRKNAVVVDIPQKEKEAVPISQYEQTARRTERVILGVLPQHQKLYSNTSFRTFHCVLGNLEIPMEHVNDDYCDCDDGSDEPSTSACSNGRFYCTFQKANVHHPDFIPSSRVNDGICDCCDGSDEWNKPYLPPHVYLPESIQVKLKVDQVPCRNRCKA